jgi:hypothetical protein
MAYFAGTGPHDKACAACRFRVGGRNRKLMSCQKFMLMGGGQGKTFPADSRSCKYFEERGQ